MEQAVKREFLEEVGMKVKPHKTYNAWSEKRNKEFVIEFDFIVKSSSTNIIMDKKEIEDYRWSTKSESKKLKMTKEMRRTVNLAFRNTGQ